MGEELLEVGPSSLLPALTGTALTRISEFVAFDGALYLSATDHPGSTLVPEGIVGHELWRFDPATGELTLVADLWPGREYVCAVD
jgi:ELWxxDGT repeat protein